MNSVAWKTLPPVPGRIAAFGEPLYGRYAGRISEINWSGLQGSYSRSKLWQRFHHKRWHYVGMGSQELFIGVAIVDLGWSMTAFAYVFDRQIKRVIADWAQDGLPSLSGGVSDQPVQGAVARFRGPGASLSLHHKDGDIMMLRVKTPVMSLQAEIELEQAAPFLLAVGPIDGGLAHATQKSSALPVSGWVEVDGQRWELGQAVACMDSSNGLLARNTSWRWACAHSQHMGFNLQQGYFGEMENVLWLDGELIPLGAANFEFSEKDPLAPWQVRTEDDLLNLSFIPEGMRQHKRDILIAASHYIQPIGTFHGTVRKSRDSAPVEVKCLLGLTEDHRSRW